jgi:hypothetical protein
MAQQSRAWSTESRLQFIEFRLYWEGRINRSDLISHFGISVPQASLDLKRYVEIAPDNLNYDKQRKAYFVTDSFVPKLTNPNSQDYLAQLETLKAERNSPFSHQSFISIAPDFDVVPIPNRVVNPEILNGVTKAIRERKAVMIRYQSMSRENPIDRWISPHALALDGFRWHIRAFCDEHNEFRDFVFGRIIAINDTKESDINPAEDIGWNTMVELTFAANEKLTDAKKRTIELDYGMKNGMVTLTVRKALANYLKIRLGLTDNIATNTQSVSDKQYLMLISEIELPNGH